MIFSVECILCYLLFSPGLLLPSTRGSPQVLVFFTISSHKRWTVSELLKLTVVGKNRNTNVFVAYVQHRAIIRDNVTGVVTRAVRRNLAAEPNTLRRLLLERLR